MSEKKPSKRSKYAPGKTLLIPMDRIRVYSRVLCRVRPEEIRELLSILRSKYSHRGEWYQDIPPIKARYVPKFSSLNIVLVEGVKHYQTARTLGLYEIKCTFVE